MRAGFSLLCVATAAARANELSLQTAWPSSKDRQALQREQASLEARLRQVSLQLDKMAAGECVVSSGGMVGAVAHAIGVPTETLSIVLLLSGVLFVWTNGEALLHTVGVLAVTTLLTLYAYARRLRRRISLRMAALGVLFAAAACVVPAWVEQNESPFNLSPTQRVLVGLSICFNAALLVRLCTRAD